MAMSTTAAMARSERRERRFTLRPPYCAGARRAEAASAARRFVKFRGLPQQDARDGRDHQLGNAGAALDVERRRAVIDDNYANLTAIIRVDRARRVEDSDAMLQRQPRARPNLRFVTARQLQRQPGRHKRARAGIERDLHISRDRGDKIEPGGAVALIGGQGEPLRMRQQPRRHIERHGLAFPCRASAAKCATSCRATSSLSISGQDLTRHRAPIRCTVLRSRP